jgi:porphobilinogen synthase
MPGVDRLSPDLIVEEARWLYEMGVPAIDLYAVCPPERKDPTGQEAWRQGNLLHQTRERLKSAVPDLILMVDVALDPFTSHGHDGIVDEKGYVVNDATVEALGKMTLAAVERGADIIAPSDMMDGRVAYLRDLLDESGYIDVGILSYTAKYASAFYGPFRDALYSAPKFGDKKSYQLNPANRREALYEAELDIEEGADMLLVKPGLPYLDILAALRAMTDLPLGAYHVSGEYSMVMAAAERGWLDADRVFLESLIAFKRAGADFIFTYTARRILPLIS